MTNTLISIITDYITYCETQKRLSSKTLKAYCTDLTQFSNFIQISDINLISISDIESFIGYLNHNFKPKTAKRKLASLKAFFHYLDYKDIIKANPFNKIKPKFREPLLLPKTIPLYTIEVFLAAIYKEISLASTVYQKKRTLLDAAIIETFFPPVCEFQNYVT